MKINPLTDYYKSVFSVLFRGIINNPSVSTQFSCGLEANEFDFLRFLRFVLYFVVGLLAFVSKDASFVRDLDSSYTVSCVCTGLRVLVE